MFDRDRAPWLVLQDASGDVAALCSTSQQNNAVIAQVAAQWTWDAYGNVFSADHIAPHPFMRVGHKGLFVERLDTGVADASVPGADYVETPRLVPFARLVYHNRNRSYSPEHGRFLQADPNASGMVVSGLAMHGSGHGPTTATLDLDNRLVDGANLYQYLRSAPSKLFDPTGLMVYDLIGNATTGALRGLVSEYADRQDFDVEWATDWSMGDDWHSRLDDSWVSLALVFGAGNGLGIDPFEEPAIGPGSMFMSTMARGVVPTRALPNPRARLLAANNILLNSRTSPNDFARAFRHSGYKPTGHFIDRLRGVGPKADPNRMSRAGLRTLTDVLTILRYGRRTVQPNGRTSISNNRLAIIVEKDGKTLVTLDPV